MFNETQELIPFCSVVKCNFISFGTINLYPQ